MLPKSPRLSTSRDNPLGLSIGELKCSDFVRLFSPSGLQKMRCRRSANVVFNPTSSAGVCVWVRANWIIHIKRYQKWHAMRWLVIKKAWQCSTSMSLWAEFGRGRGSLFCSVKLTHWHGLSSYTLWSAHVCCLLFVSLIVTFHHAFLPHDWSSSSLFPRGLPLHRNKFIAS